MGIAVVLDIIETIRGWKRRHARVRSEAVWLRTARGDGAVAYVAERLQEPDLSDGKRRFLKAVLKELEA